MLCINELYNFQTTQEIKINPNELKIIILIILLLIFGCKKKDISESCQEPSQNMAGIWKGSWKLPPDPPYNNQTGQICSKINQNGNLLNGKLYDMDNSSQFFDSIDIKGIICGSSLKLQTDTMTFIIKIVAKFNGSVINDSSYGTFKIYSENYESQDGTWWMKKDTANTCK